MKILKTLVFIAAVLLIPIGLILRDFDWPLGNLFIALGFCGFFVYYAKQTIKGIKNKIPKSIFLLQIMIVLMSFALYTRYFYHAAGDVPSIIIIPLFIIILPIYLFKETKKPVKLTTASLLYLILTIPLFGLNFHKSPRQYIPLQWYNRFGDVSSTAETLPYSFEYPETEQLSMEAFELMRNNQYREAIEVFEQARIIEPKNPKLLFNLSELYARINDLQTAILLLDSAILIDNTYPLLYNNRGLLYYKQSQNNKAIVDYQKAIDLDSTQPEFHGNLALVYYYMDSLDLACQQFEIARSLGLKIDEHQGIQHIEKLSCR